MEQISSKVRPSQYTLDEVFVYAYKALVDFNNEICDSKINSQMKASRDAYIAAHKLLVETLTTACNISHEYNKVDLVTFRDVKISLDILTSITQLLPTLLRIPHSESGL